MARSPGGPGEHIGASQHLSLILRSILPASFRFGNSFSALGEKPEAGFIR